MANLSEAYETAVRAVVASVSDVMDGEWGERTWERIVVNYESLMHTEENESSTIAFSLARTKDGPLEKAHFRLSNDAKAALERIKEIVHEQNGDYWTTCDLVIERDGAYRFDFSYGEPYRISGNLNDRRFNDYLENYLREKGAGS